MAHRLQVTLDDGQYERLQAQSRRTGASLAELIRRAIDQVGYELDRREQVALLEQSFGAWADRPEPQRVASGTAYVDEIRGRSRP